jgi:hypothetical protein
MLGTPGDRRVTFFQQALRNLNLPLAQVVAWADFLSDSSPLFRGIEAGAVLRIESPGRNLEVDRALLSAGASEDDDEEESLRLTREEVSALVLDRGRIFPYRQWFLGFRSALRRIVRELHVRRTVTLMNSPSEIEVMFDKRRSHALLAHHGIPVPASLGVIRNVEELFSKMQRRHCPRVFIKPAHGSSASSVIALAQNGPRLLAKTTMEIVRHNGETQFYNSRKIRQYTRLEDVTEIVNAVCRERAQVEEWVPKAGIADHTFDLRIVTIAGQPRHTVVRLSKAPMTNLHLGAHRGNVQEVRNRMPEAAWSAVEQSCRRTASVFPGSLYAGIDVLVTPSFCSHAICEVNAFGDLLPDVLCGGMDTYTMEIRAMCPTAGVSC